MTPLAPYVQLGALHPHLDAVQLAEQAFQVIQLPVNDAPSDRLEAVKLTREAFETPGDDSRIALVSDGNVIVATVAKRAWDIYLATPMAKGHSPECKRARREVIQALGSIADADLTRSTPWDVVYELAGKLTQRSVIAGKALDTIVAGSFIGVDPHYVEIIQEVALLRIREMELTLLHQQHLQAFLAGQAPFDGIAAKS